MSVIGPSMRVNTTMLFPDDRGSIEIETNSDGEEVFVYLHEPGGDVSSLALSPDMIVALANMVSLYADAVVQS